MVFTQMVMSTAAVLGAVAGIFGAVFAGFKIYNACYEMVKHQKEQDKTIEALKENDRAVMVALLGVLEGLIEQGCNGTVHSARDELQKHIIEGGAKK